MSAEGSFSSDGERRRVAHQPNESIKDVIRALAYKKQSVAQVSFNSHTWKFVGRSGAVV